MKKLLPLLMLWCLAASAAFAQGTTIVAAISINQAVCSNDAELTASVLSGGQAPFTFTWSTNEITPVIQVGPGNFEVTIRDANGVERVLSTTVKRYIIPEISTQNQNIECNNRTVRLTVGGVGGSPFVWENGTSINPRNINVAGTYTVSITNGDMCTTSITVADFTTDEIINLFPTYCPNEGPFCFSPGDCFSNGSQTRTVTKADGCTVTTNVTITNIQYEVLITGDVLACDKYTVPGTVPAVEHTTSGFYVDELPGFGTNGCKRFVSTNLRIGRSTDQSVTKYICQGDSYAVGDSIYTKTGNYVNNLKSVLATQCDSIVRTQLIVDVPKYEKYVLRRCSTFTFTPPTGSTGPQTFTQTGTLAFGRISQGGCLDSVIFEVTISPAIAVALNVVKCPGEFFVLGADTIRTDGTYNNTQQSYQYSDGSGGCDSTTTLNFRIFVPLLETISPRICNGASYTIGSVGNEETFTTSGTYVHREYTYPYQGATQGCDSVVTTINLQISDFSVVPYVTYDNLCSNGRTGANIILTTTGGGSNYMYNWSDTPTSGLLIRECLPAGEYSVTVTESSANSCSYTQIFVIEKNDPNICLTGNEGFTPDGDPFNENWQIPCIEKDDTNLVQVYNRWGQLMFEQKNYTGDWNGNVDGKPLPDATYYYVVKTKSRTYRGTVTIMRQ